MALELHTYRIGVPVAAINQTYSPGAASESAAPRPDGYSLVLVDEDYANDIHTDLSKLGWVHVDPGDARPELTEFTQTYSTTDTTFPAYTSNPESSAYAGINGALGTNCAAVTDLNSLRTAYENLRAHCEAQGKLINAVLDVLQAHNIVG